MKYRKPLARTFFFIFLLACFLTGLVGIGRVSVNAAPQMQVVAHLVISQVYGGGGNSGATFTNDYVELFNPSDTDLSVDGWSIQYTSAAGTSWTVTNLSGSIVAGQYYLVQLGSGGSSGISLPTPDTVGTVNMAATAGKVALVNTTTALTGSGCPFDASVIDFIGYGSGTSCSESSATSAPSATIAVFRITNGCTDTNNNNADFATGTPAPRNSASPITTCSDQFTATAAAVNATGTVAAITATASAINATGTAIAITNAPPADGVVISEFRTRGPNGAEDEYIELYNPTSTVVDISGWKINVSNDSGGTSTRATIPASTILRSGQYYLLANSGTNGYSGVVPANQTYGQGITNSGGIALVRPDNTVVDQVGLGASSAYKEGTPLSPLPSNSNQSYERKLGGASDSCQDTNDNSNDFSIITSDPKNYSSQLSRCGTLLAIPALTTTTITADTPDPSLTNASVIVSVKVTGGSTVPTGTVDITGANTNCTITLNSSGTGSCSVVFSSSGTKTLTAIYLGNQSYLSSSDTETHQTATIIRTPTPTPRFVLPPPPPLIAINEFVPRPGHDWNNDGIINTGDEYIELINHGVVDVNLSGYRLDDEANIGSSVYTLPSVVLKPGERIVFYGSQTNLLLSDGGDGVRLLRSNGQLVDAYNYFTVNFPDQSFCRLPDNGGLDDWNTNCYPTPGLSNSLSGSILGPPTRGGVDEPLCPIADTLPEVFVLAECSGFGNNIWNRYYWDEFGWFDEMSLPNVNGKWDVYAD